MGVPFFRQGGRSGKSLSRMVSSPILWDFRRNLTGKCLGHDARAETDAFRDGLDFCLGQPDASDGEAETSEHAAAIIENRRGNTGDTPCDLAFGNVPAPLTHVFERGLDRIEGLSERPSTNARRS